MKAIIHFSTLKHRGYFFKVLLFLRMYRMVLLIKINYYCFLQVQQQSILQWQMFHNTIHKGHHPWPWTVATIAFKGQQQLDLVVPIMVVVAHYNCKALIVQWVPTSENWSFEIVRKILCSLKTALEIDLKKNFFKKENMLNTKEDCKQTNKIQAARC